jgi:hypothetical protein
MRESTIEERKVASEFADEQMGVGQASRCAPALGSANCCVARVESVGAECCLYDKCTLVAEYKTRCGAWSRHSNYTELEMEAAVNCARRLADNGLTARVIRVRIQVCSQVWPNTEGQP